MAACLELLGCVKARITGRIRTHVIRVWEVLAEACKPACLLELTSLGRDPKGHFATVPSDHFSIYLHG